MSPSKTYVHALATSNTEAPAQKWTADVNRAISEGKMQLID